MCDPVTLGLASFGIGALQSVAGYAGQKQAADANQQAAEESWRNNQDQITKREMQEADALAQKQQQQRIGEAEAKAETETSAAAAGISGVSVSNLIADVGRRAATNRRVAQDNTDMLISQLQTQRKGLNSQAQSQINSVAQPSPLSLIAGLGSAGVSGYNAYVGKKQI